MKCPICGKEEFRKSDAFEVSGDASLTRQPKVYACVNCGYLVMFDDFFVKVKQAKKHYKDLVKELKDLDKQILKIEDKYGIDALREKNDALEEQKKSLDVTRRQIIEIEKQQEENLIKIKRLLSEQEKELGVFIRKREELRKAIASMDCKNSHSLHKENLNNYEKL